jgi:hypothetical protein
VRIYFPRELDDGGIAIIQKAAGHKRIACVRESPFRDVRENADSLSEAFLSA